MCIVGAGFLCLIQGWLFYYAMGKGNPKVLIYGTDSYGNVCNQENDAIAGASKSGRDTTGLK